MRALLSLKTEYGWVVSRKKDMHVKAHSVTGMCERGSFSSRAEKEEEGEEEEAKNKNKNKRNKRRRRGTRRRRRR